MPRLQEVERAAGEAFRSLGMDAVADDEPPALETLAGYLGRSWVAVEGGRVAGYLLLDVVDGHGHVEQVSVDPAHARRGIGRALLDVAGAQHRTLTLTTFADVPWNAPYYRRLGFRDLPDPGPGLRELRRREAEHGLDAWPRVCLVRHLP
nr:GNAT family N-acetyltransferase [Kineococcus aurantiacus]